MEGVRSRAERLTRLLGIRYPVLQAGMGAATDPRLVAAVAEGGGLGILGCLRRSGDEVRGLLAEIRFAAVCSQPRDRAPRRRGAARHAGGAGPDHLHRLGRSLGHRRGRARRGGDRRPPVGHAGGRSPGQAGHVGRRSTFTIVPEVVDAVAPTPVLAAGGVTDARGVAAALLLGASGVLVGTRFIATPEAPVAEAWKQAIISACGDETLASKFYDAMRAEVWPGAIVRTIENRWLEEWGGRPEDWERVAEELRPSFFESFREGGFPMAGEGVGLIHEAVPAGELPRRLWEGALELVERAARS